MSRKSLRRLKEARTLGEEVLNKRRERLGAENKLTIEALAERVVEARVRSLGTSHPVAIHAKENLLTVLVAAKQFETAAALLRQVAADLDSPCAPRQRRISRRATRQLRA
jgi:hypothetical protein